MTEGLLRLAQRIGDELIAVDRLANRAHQGWARAQQTSDDLYLDGVALNVHGFYAGLERLFVRIATSIDCSLPQASNWHQLLLPQMADEVPGVRPAVISAHSRDALDEYRSFRHVVRNNYSFQLDPARLRRLVDQLPTTWSQAREELLAFASFLQQRA